MKVRVSEAYFTAVISAISLLSVNKSGLLEVLGNFEYDVCC